MEPRTRYLVLAIIPASAALTAAALFFFNLAAGMDPAGLTPVLDAVLSDLADIEWISAGRGRALCIGPDPCGAAAEMRRLGFEAAVGDACCGLPFVASSFDFALAPALDRARVPARVILEMERVLRPGRVGVVLRPGWTRPDRLMRAVAPVVSLLRFSDVVGARAVNGSAMVVFRKRGPRTARVSDPCGSDGVITKIPLMLDEITEFVQTVLVVVGATVRSSE